MPFLKTSWYDNEKNIAMAYFSGSPDCLMDIELLADEAKEEWGSLKHKVYTIVDISDLGRISYAMLSFYAKRMGRLFRERCELSVVVTKTVRPQLSIRLMKLLVNQSFDVAKTLDQALVLVKARQMAKGVFVPLD